MKLKAFQCCVCSRWHVMNDGVLLKIDYKTPVELGHDGFTVVEEWHCGVRAVCRWCLTAFHHLPRTEDDDARGSQPAPGP